MVTPRYVATKVGEQYELIRENDAPAPGPVVWAAIGGALALYGLTRRDTPGLLAIGLGAASLYYAFTQQAQPAAPRQPAASQPSTPIESQAPSYAGNHIPTSQLPRDQIDEASMESFPASDAPSYA